jgi:hypothetical protein
MFQTAYQRPEIFTQGCLETRVGGTDSNVDLPAALFNLQVDGGSVGRCYPNGDFMSGTDWSLGSRKSLRELRLRGRFVIQGHGRVHG